MKHLRRILAALFAVLAVLAFVPVLEACAAGVSVSAPGLVSVGDTVRVSVTFTGKKIMGVNASFSYDSSVLSFAGGSSSVSDGKIVLYASEGKKSLSVSFNFTAVAEGTCRIGVSINECLDEDMNSLGGGSGAATVTVGKKQTPRPTPKPVPVDQREVEAAYGDATMYVWHMIPGNAKAPEGFEESQTVFKGETVGTVAKEDNGIVLVYITDVKGGNARWALLRGETLLPFVPLKEQAEAVLLPLPDETLFPVGYTRTEIEREEGKIEALVSDEDPSALLLYAWGPGGESWFQTDASLSGLMRYRQVRVETTVEVFVTPAPTPKPTPTPTPRPTATPEPTPGPAPDPWKAFFSGSGPLGWILFGITATALAASWIFFKKDAVAGLLKKKAPSQPASGEENRQTSEEKKE